MTGDHIIRRKRGGTDGVNNLQLLCGACNSAKGTGEQAELLAKLKEQSMIYLNRTYANLDVATRLIVYNPKMCNELRYYEPKEA